MGHRTGRSSKVLITIVAALALTLAPMASASAANTGPLGTYKHIVIIYEENHSFDNLYGNWGSVDGQHVVGRADADAAHTTQVAWDGTPYACILQKDVNLTTPPLAASTTPDCSAASVTLEDGSVLPFASHFGNAPYNIDQYIPATASTCPTRDTLFAFPNGIPDGSGLPGGCTRDLVHRFYQEQYQLNGGQHEPLHDGQRLSRHVDGLLRHDQAPAVRLPAQEGRTRSTSSPTTSSRPRSGARSSTTSTSSRRRRRSIPIRTRAP